VWPRLQPRKIHAEPPPLSTRHVRNLTLDAHLELRRWLIDRRARNQRSAGWDPVPQEALLRTACALASCGLSSRFGLVEPPPSKDPLHGVTLKQLLTELVAEHGWAGLAERIDIRCFRFDPSLNSSLVFLRRTPWARAKVEALYVEGKRRR